MVEQFHSSFIPKKASEDVDKPVRKRSVGWFMALAVILVVVSVAGAIGVFSYTKILQGSIDRKEASLNEAKDVFETGLIRELTRLDNRLVITKEIIDGHLAPSGIFDALEDLTLENVQFNSFKYDITTEGHEISMSGTAKSFGTIALQSDAFGASDAIRNPIFSGLTVDTDGNVGFQFKGTVSPEVLVYEARQLPDVPDDSGDDTSGDDVGTTTDDTGTTTDDDLLGDDDLGDIDDILGDLDDDFDSI